MRERRRDRRTVLRKPVLATVESAPVFVLDVSRGGMRLAHKSKLPVTPGGICRVDVPSDGETARLDCAIVHTAMQHANEAATNLFQTGLRFVAVDEELRNRLLKIIRADAGKKK
ncbi:MAG: PilZ domain-containing protein [Thermoanaerobaculia bacterium]